MAILNKFQILQEMLNILPRGLSSPSMVGMVDGWSGLLWSFTHEPKQLSIIFIVRQNNVDKENDYCVVSYATPDRTEWIPEREWVSLFTKTLASPLWTQKMYKPGVPDAPV